MLIKFDQFWSNLIIFDQNIGFDQIWSKLINSKIVWFGQKTNFVSKFPWQKTFWIKVLSKLYIVPWVGLYKCIASCQHWFLDKRSLLIVKLLQTPTLQMDPTTIIHSCFVSWIPFVKGWNWCWRYPKAVPTSILWTLNFMDGNQWRPTGTVNTSPLPPMISMIVKWGSGKYELQWFHCLDWSIYHGVQAHLQFE